MFRIIIVFLCTCVCVCRKITFIHSEYINIDICISVHNNYQMYLIWLRLLLPSLCFRFRFHFRLRFVSYAALLLLWLAHFWSWL